MGAKRYLMLGMISLIAVNMLVSGCAVNFYKQNPRSKTKIRTLENKISNLETQRAAEQKKFEEVKRMLEQKLKGQIADESISLEMTDRGLVIILSDDVLFNSGKAVVKDNVSTVLNSVAKIINSEVPDKNIGVSGHTDNVPITHSQWKSNWELSTARATNVLHYLVAEGVSPNRLSATGYGEHRPVASNATAEGRAKNRRVEIVILPEYAEKRHQEKGGNYIK